MTNRGKFRARTALLLAALALAPRLAAAQAGSARYSAILLDARGGTVIEGVNQDDTRFPASLTKLMTLYMTFEALRDRRIRLSDPVPISAWAAAQPPSKLGLRPGESFTVEQAILGLVTKSANDAAAALGELLGGTEDRFAQMMTLRAHAIGMSHSSFRNASGLPDIDQWTTARDLGTLGRRLVLDFPQLYTVFSAPGFVWHNRTIPNHDSLLRTYPGADGMKTGYTDYAGHNLVTSAVRGGVRLIGVVMGAASNAERDQQMTAMLDDGFNRRNVGPASSAMTGPMALPAGPPVIPVRASAASGTQPVPGGAEAAAASGPALSIGPFPTARTALQTARYAARLAGAGQAEVVRAAEGHKTLYLARLTGIGAVDTRALCASLARKGPTCQADPGP